MKRNSSILCFIIIAALVIFSIALAGCASAAKTTSAETTAASPNQVICKNNKFNPDALTVKVGTTVTWINQDGYIHIVTSGTSPSERSGLFDSGNLNGGETFSFTFDETGTYDYFCIPHFSLGMIGKIIATE
jgi:plastocyanin